MYSLYVNNQHGTLVYEKHFSDEIKLNSNEEIRLASMLHGISTISEKINVHAPPINESKRNIFKSLEKKGIETIEGDGFKIQCYDTLTGIKIFIVHKDDLNIEANTYLKRVHELYSDIILKNPFYDIDMPIRSAVFNEQIEKLFAGL
ncbi:trafficking protein particle complex subunit 4, putative [Plasmodium knowlesi strain H]|uniref:Trafficking protein particle complex subunit n=3 Tax=Plasmodium knowlesi TaxID=5850 RepID=A0A5K1VNI6_PLAKH|nr:trafficking protein particle complex subunit 4, putative [Plasmodium knowlesi strain H]OTN65993.1 putative Sybindin-like protein [Plasmodium knowlesi]CAA9987961.1 trafficking protein particle complex subunit 4, putative [Plasmodium knowlesi strain H]SBO22150.1 trafficking protein particle complex subunit 4, putative [Plasmodium knowlesi strain H]SBO29181.1 trafficking protein particle complex subunit 4, putative [Plasmodium knowlesi strain H]VVS77435.1 trafficking protein particle complex s|eukprot:XP_002258940.1 Sybindin-like protein, putative [Plasmodium knowlesi strain H]